MRRKLAAGAMVPVLWSKACWAQQPAAPAEPNPFSGAIGAFRAMLDKAGIRYVYYESPGTTHEWLTGLRDLHEFAPLLFKD